MASHSNPFPPSNYAVFRSMTMEVDPSVVVEAKNTEKQKRPTTTTNHHSPNRKEHDDDANVPTRVWKVTCLPSLPKYHATSWNTMVIQDMELNAITYKISEFLRLESIAASYHDHQRPEDDPAKVLCTTGNLVKFVIQLWKDVNTQAGVILQVQRIQGNGMEFQQIRSKLVRSLQDSQHQTRQHETVPSDPVKGPSMPMYTLEPQPVNGRAVTYQPHHTSHHSHNPNNAPAEFYGLNLMTSENFQQRRLGLENMVTLTDPAYTFPAFVEQACRLVLSDHRFHRALMQYLPNGNAAGIADVVVNNHGFRDIEHQHDEDDDNGLWDSGMGGQYMALKILANALTFAVQQEAAFLDMRDTEFWSPLASLLEANIALTVCQTLVASISVRCLRLMQSLPNGSVAGVSEGHEKKVQLAFQYGRCYNLELEQETHQYLVGRVQ